MKATRAAITWRDPYGDSSWLTLTEARKLRPVTVVTHGWILNNTTDLLIVAASRSSDGGWSDVTAIPKGCVVGVTEHDNES